MFPAFQPASSPDCMNGFPYSPLGQKMMLSFMYVYWQWMGTTTFMIKLKNTNISNAYKLYLPSYYVYEWNDPDLNVKNNFKKSASLAKSWLSFQFFCEGLLAMLLYYIRDLLILSRQGQLKAEGPASPQYDSHGRDLGWEVLLRHSYWIYTISFNTKHRSKDVKSVIALYNNTLKYFLRQSI